MSQSEVINELASALSKAQGKFGHIMKAKAVKFGQTNYAYADLAGCFDACREALSENGLAIVQQMQQLGNGWVVVTKLMHASGQWIDSVLPIIVEGKPQDLGSRITYMRKYQLWSILGLATEDDDGQSEAKHGYEESQKTDKNNQYSTQNKQPSAQQDFEQIERIGKPEIIALTTLIQNLDEESNKSFLDWINKNFNTRSIQDIPKAYYEKCMASLNARIKYLKNQGRFEVAV